MFTVIVLFTPTNFVVFSVAKLIIVSFGNINKLTHLEFIETIQRDKKEFTDLLIDFYQHQCESITLDFLTNQIIYLKSIGKK